MTSIARLVALFATLTIACAKSDQVTAPPPSPDERATPDDVANDEAPDEAPPPRAQLSELTFAALDPAADDPLPGTCRRAMSRAEICPCLTRHADAPPDAYTACDAEWFTGDTAWSIAEQASDGFSLYYLAHEDAGAYTLVATVQFLSPRGDIDESYSTMYITERVANGVHIVEVVGSVDAHDPEGPPEQGPPLRHVAICRHGGDGPAACATVDHETEYTLRDDGTLEITASQMGPEPGIYDLAF